MQGQHITEKDLQNLVNRLNEGQPESYNRMGAYIIGMAYGGYRLEKVTCNKGGAIKVISPDGYGTKKQLYSFLKGYILGKEETKP